MALIDRVFIDDEWVGADGHWENTIGDAVFVASIFGGLIADNYTLVVSDVSGGTATITVSASRHNPYNGRVIENVALDGATIYQNIVPGFQIVYNALTANGDTTVIYGGSFLGTFDGSGANAGIPSEGVRHQVENDDYDLQDCKATLPLRNAIRIEITGHVLYAFEYVVGFATEKVVDGQIAPYVFTISNTSGAGAEKVCDLTVDADGPASLNLFDVENSVVVTGEGIKAVEFHRYMFLSSPLTGLVFYIHPDCQDGDEANVFIFSSRYVQIAPDEDGVEGAYGTTDVVLTGPGRDSGVMLSGDLAYYWTRILVPSGSAGNANPYPANILLKGSYDDAAPWV